MRALVLITGIAEKDYGMSTVRKHKYYKTLRVIYDEIVEIPYQLILDKHALAFKTTLDPARMVLTRKGRKVVEYVENRLHRLHRLGFDIDIMSHSLGSWITLKCNVKVKNLILLAPPPGWATPFLRLVVKMNVGTPRIRAATMLWLYSKKDPVSKCPPKESKKYNVGRDNYWIETGTSHNMKRYLSYMQLKGIERLLI